MLLDHVDFVKKKKEKKLKTGTIRLPPFVRYRLMAAITWAVNQSKLWIYTIHPIVPYLMSSDKTNIIYPNLRILGRGNPHFLIGRYMRRNGGGYQFPSRELKKIPPLGVVSWNKLGNMDLKNVCSHCVNCMWYYSQPAMPTTAQLLRLVSRKW